MKKQQIKTQKMKKEIIQRLQKSFEDYSQKAEDIEFWFARDLQALLDYNDWRNFVNVIEKAEIACKSSGQEVQDHFVDITKKVKIGSEAEREIEDIMQDEDFIEQKKRIMMNLMEENLEKEIKDESENAD